MIVYGDRERVEPTGRALDQLARDAESLAPAATPLERAAAATRLLIASGELAQGLLDASHAARGFDEWDDLAAACADLTTTAARRVVGPLPSLPPGEGRGEGHPGAHRACDPYTDPREGVRSALARLARLPLPESVTIRVPEGFAHYALYPELYASAARAFLREHPGPLMVVGLRSIGTGLAAVVAEAAGASERPATIRPVGHPFRREVRIGPDLERRLLDLPPTTRFAIVDEGPGLSGSSFGAAADWLEGRGIGRDRLVFFPGHAHEPGPEARPEHRARWRSVARCHTDFEDWRRAAFPGASWFADDPSADSVPVEDVAGGAWRARHYPDEADWPPVHRYQERRKYLYSHAGRTWLAKFAGLGRHGDAKLVRARLLEAAGWTAPVAGLRHGFLVQEWLDDARPANAPGRSDRASLLDAAADYLALRARAFPAGPSDSGADPASLLEMARVNAGERLGPEAAEAVGRWREHLPVIGDAVRRVITDNRLPPWEWLARPDGRWIKADALDHAEAHDCVGAQDLAWDVAGLIAEFDLDDAEADALADRIARGTSWRPIPRVLGFHRACYLAFAVGYHAMAASAHAATDPSEAARLQRAADRHASRLARALAEPIPTRTRSPSR